MTIAVLCVLSTGYIMSSKSETTKNEEQPYEPFCRFEGTYILQPLGGAASFGLDMAISLDPRNDRVAIVHDLANYDVTLGGLFPTAKRLTTGQGEAKRISSRSFDYTIHFWALDGNNQRVALIISSGTKYFSEADCSRYEVPAGTLSVYYPSQDADDDGFPDPGQSPSYCFPLICKAKRISALPPCQLQL